ncbi:MAG: SagB/ThcOx family dehydrogenase [Bacteroidales bacterium]|nr:SagB/ThcOx family dehydrogenase [Bacteroidales bacterium]
MKFKILTILCFFLLSGLFSQDLVDIALPDPVKTGGMPLMEALNLRQSLREFSGEPFSLQEISNLLWAANGYNRPDVEKRTAPTAMNNQEIDIYVSISSGIYLWDAKTNTLKAITAGDYRGDMGRQNFVRNASLVLIYVADYSKMSVILDQDRKDFYSAVDVGFISQNVYLYAASRNLATVVLGLFNKNDIATVLPLSDKQKIILTQPVGFPK